ncbi:MAG: stalk domain-containing protein [Desulfitobacteriaceae bacterium]|nr:stalk domain-containing protein [Desulfitobacteriaceae bacterium]
MYRKLRLLLVLVTVTIFMLNIGGMAFGADTLENPLHKEQRRFNVKTLTQNAGEEFRLKVEQKLEYKIKEGIEDEELNKSEIKGLEKYIARLEQTIAKVPGDPELLWWLAVAYRNVGEYDKTIEVLKELEGKLSHPTAKVAVLLAQCLKAKGDREAALAELSKLIESPETVSGAVYAYRGILKEELGEVKEAAEDMEKAIAAEPKEDDLYMKVSELYKKAGKKGVKVFVKGRKPSFDAEPFVKEGRTMVPVRAIAEALGLEVDYQNGVATITNPANGKTVILYVGRSEAEVNGQKVALDVPAQVVPPGRTVVPLRFVSENLGADVKWFEDGQVVAVN